MEIRDLEAFYAVSTYLNYSEAAKKCFISQPTLSQRVANLEKEFGFKLFARTSRHVELTPEGMCIVPFVKKALDSMADINHEIHQITNTGHLKIAMANYVSDYSAFDVSKKIVKFIRIFPDIKVTTSQLPVSDCLFHVKNLDMDLAIVPMYDFEPLSEELTAVTIQKIRMVLATGRDDCKNVEDVLKKTRVVLEDIPGSELLNERIKKAALEIYPGTEFYVEKVTGFIDSLLFSGEYSSMYPELYLSNTFSKKLSMFTSKDLDFEMHFCLVYNNNKKNINVKKMIEFVLNDKS